MPRLSMMLILAVGCGRHATQADCDVIVDRMVIVKLRQKNVIDPASIAKLQADLRKDPSVDFPNCVGRRITDAAMQCIQKADSEDEIVKCLR